MSVAVYGGGCSDCKTLQKWWHVDLPSRESQNPVHILLYLFFIFKILSHDPRINA